MRRRSTLITSLALDEPDLTLLPAARSIEDVARDDPSAIITTPIPFEEGLSKQLAGEIAQKLGFKSESQDKAADIFIKLYQLFKERDATQIEINPLAEVEGGDVLCMDAKLGFDENADFRQAVRPLSLPCSPPGPPRPRC